MRKWKAKAVVMAVSLLISAIFPGQAVKAAGKAGLSADVYETSGGFESSNVSANSYINAKRWTTPVYSTLYQNSDGSFWRVEASEKEGVVYIENYSSKFKLASSKKLEMALPVYGGCFIGSDANYLVFGQNNPDESDEVEVVRIVKYNKSWKKISSASVFGANTQTPFQAGSLRMAESGGTLFIHTSHRMYKSSDGNNHQANMTFVLDEAAMKITQSWYGVMNIGYGYVSHSFNQFVVTDGTSLYRLDHGDAYPRAVVLTKAPVGKITSSSNTKVLEIQGNVGANDTGVEVGGLALAGSSLVTVGNSVNQDDAETYSAGGIRNIYVTSTDTELSNTKIHWLTSYGEDSTVSVKSPHLVKVSDKLLYVLWEETDSTDKSTVVKIAGINAKGEKQADISTLSARLSDCVPVVTGNREIVWYVTNNGAPVFYRVETLASQTITAKNFTKTYGAKAFSLGAKSSSGAALTYKSSDKTVAKVSKDGKVTIKGCGITNITITAAATDKYSQAQKTIKLTVKPQKAAISSVKSTKKKTATVKWKKDKTASGYIIECATDSKFKKNKVEKTVSKAKTVSLTVKNLKPGKKYYVRVCAYAKSGKTKVQGAWSKVLTVNVKKQ